MLDRLLSPIKIFSYLSFQTHFGIIFHLHCFSCLADLNIVPLLVVKATINFKYKNCN